MRLRNVLGAALVAALMAGSVGCYGPFRLTKKLYDWNGQVGTRWVNEGVFLAMAVLPVYAFSLLGDAIVFNSIEFWTGDNPIQKASRSIEQGGRQAVLNYDAERRRLRIDGFEAGRWQGTVIIEPGADGMIARDGAGRVLMTARTAGRDVQVTRN